MGGQTITEQLNNNKMTPKKRTRDERAHTGEKQLNMAEKS